MKKLFIILSVIVGLCVAHVVTAAPTSTPVQNLIIMGLKSSPTAHLTVDSNGLVGTSTAGSGGGLASTTPFSTGYIPVASSSNLLTNSQIYQSSTNGFITIGGTISSYPLYIQNSNANLGIAAMQNTANNGYSAMDMYDDQGTKVGGFGVGGTGTSLPFKGNFYLGTNAASQNVVFLPNNTLKFSISSVSTTIVEQFAQSGGTASLASTTINGNATTTGTSSLSGINIPTLTAGKLLALDANNNVVTTGTPSGGSGFTDANASSGIRVTTTTSLISIQNIGVTSINGATGTLTGVVSTATTIVAGGTATGNSFTIATSGSMWSNATNCTGSTCTFGLSSSSLNLGLASLLNGIGVQSSSPVSSDSIPRFQANGNITNSTIFQSGANIGINPGFALPTQDFVVFDTAANNTAISVVGSQAATSTGIWQARTDRILFGSTSNHPLTFVTNAIEAMRVASTGDMSVGTTTDNGTFSAANASGSLSLQVASNTTLNNYKFTVAKSLAQSSTIYLGVTSSGIPLFLGSSTVSLGGASLTGGTCTSTATIVPFTLQTSTDIVNVTPQSYPGADANWHGYINAVGSATSSVTVEVCEAVTATPAATQYNFNISRMSGM